MTCLLASPVPELTNEGVIHTSEHRYEAGCLVQVLDILKNKSSRSPKKGSRINDLFVRKRQDPLLRVEMDQREDVTATRDWALLVLNLGVLYGTEGLV